MNLTLLLQPNHIQCQQDVTNKKSLLEKLSFLFSNSTEEKLMLFDAFLSREDLGSTALGHGVAIPHIRTALVTNPKLAIIHLSTPINFDAEDSKPVDIIFAIIAPENNCSEHLNLLAQCSSLLSSPNFRDNIRQANNADDVYKLINTTAHSLESI